MGWHSLHRSLWRNDWYVSRLWPLYFSHAIRISAAHSLEAIFFRAWYMLPTLVLCGACELLGWAGRYWGHLSPYNRDPFMMQ